MSTHEIEERINTIRDRILEEEGQLMDAELHDDRRRVLASKRELDILKYQLKTLQKRHGARLRPFLLLLLVGGMLVLQACTPLM